MSGQTLVLLFRAAEEADEARDLQGLEQTVRIARQLAAVVDDALRPEAEQLVALCADRLDRARDAVKAEATSAAPEACPACGRALPEGGAVRCRACGTLLV